jgi:DNA-directed RNA polymerase specialized sigma24 family protein
MEFNGAQELLQCCARQRDPRAWQEFRSRFEARLQAGVRRGLRRSGTWRPPIEEEDLLQEVYCKLLDNGGRHLLRCRGGADEAVSAYLGRIAETVAIDRVRAEVAIKRGRGQVVGLPRQAGGGELETADPSMGPEQKLLQRETSSVFLRRCREVVGPRQPKRDLRVLYLACIEGWPSRDIARALGSGLTANSVDSLVHRARRRLAARGIPLPTRGRPVTVVCG